MSFAKITPVNSVENSRVFSIEIEDDVYRENIDRYIGEFNSKKTLIIPSLLGSDASLYGAARLAILNGNLIISHHDLV